MNDSLICLCGVTRSTCPYHHCDSDTFKTIGPTELMSNRSALTPIEAARVAWLEVKARYEAATAEVRALQEKLNVAATNERALYADATKARDAVRVEIDNMYATALHYPAGVR